MALLDFLGQSPYGTAQGPNLAGQAGVAQGPTWGQMLSAAAQYGGTRSGQAFAPLLAQQGNPGTSVGSNNMLNLGGQKPQGDDTWKVLLSIFGLGV